MTATYQRGIRDHHYLSVQIVDEKKGLDVNESDTAVTAADNDDSSWRSDSEDEA